MGRHLDPFRLPMLIPTPASDDKRAGLTGEERRGTLGTEREDSRQLSSSSLILDTTLALGELEKGRGQTGLRDGICR